MPNHRLIGAPRLLLGAALLTVLGACSSLGPHDPLHIDLAGIEPLPGQGLEMRVMVKLRVQNPNDTAIAYHGVALDLDVNQQPLASGVSDQSGQIPRFGEALIDVPMTVSAFSAMRQAWGTVGHAGQQGLPYRLNGKLANGWFGTTRFSTSGTLDWPAPAPQ